MFIIICSGDMWHSRCEIIPGGVRYISAAENQGFSENAWVSGAACIACISLSSGNSDAM